MTLLLLVLLALFGCGRAEPSPSMVRSDSAGIVLIESTVPRWSVGGGWTVDPAPALDLATPAEGQVHEFFRVSDATRLRDGSWAVAEQGSSQVKFFSPTGRFVRAVGRDGEGPGEFRRLVGIQQLSTDSLIAFDYWLGRLTVLSPEGVVAHTIRPFDAGTRLWRVYAMASGGFVGVTHSYDVAVEAPSLHRIPWIIAGFDIDGARIDTIAIIAGSESFQFDGGDARALFPKNGHVAVAGNRIFLGSADSMQVAEYDRDGRLVRLIRIPGFDLRLTIEQVAAERASVMPSNTPQWIRDLITGLPSPATRPAYSSLLVDPGGNLWAERFRGVSEADQPPGFVVFDPEGAWLGYVELPPRFRTLEVGMDYILGVARDELDVESVQVLKLNRY